MIDFQQIRLNHDLLSVVEQYLGKPKNGKWLCPFHAEKTPSLTVKNNHFKCWGCKATGDVTDFVAMMDSIDIKTAAQKLGGPTVLDLGLSAAEVRAKQAEIRAEYQRRLTARQEEERKRREEALNKVMSMTDKVEWYHSQVHLACDYWHSQGLPDKTIGRYRLGFCPQCPTYPNSPSYVIPYYANNSLISIRHRLAKPNGSGKYRPEFAGLPNQLFNLDALKFDSSEEIYFGLLEPGQVILAEGEVKSIYLSDVVGMPAVGVPGASSWQDEWIGLFAHTSLVYVVFDPDAQRQAGEVTQAFNRNGVKAVQVTLTCKADDFFVRFGGGVGDFLNMLRQGRKLL